MSNVSSTSQWGRPECQYNTTIGKIPTQDLPEHGSWVAVADINSTFTRAMAQCCEKDNPSDFYGPHACYRYCNVTVPYDVGNVSDCLKDTFKIPLHWITAKASFSDEYPAEKGSGVKLGAGTGKAGLAVMLVALLGVFGVGL